MSTKLWVEFFVCFSVCSSSLPAVAQTGLGHIGPTGAQLAGAVIGAAAVITVIVYFSIPKQKTVEGCVESANGVSVLTNDKDHHAYALDSDTIVVKPGQRLKLKGKKRKDKSGAWHLEVKKVVRDEGACGT